MSPPRRPRGGGLSAGGWAPQLTPRTAVRIAVLGAIAMGLLGLLLVRLWFLQVIGGEDYAAAAESNRLRTVITEAPRGNILDRNGDVLVANRPGKNVVVHPRELTGARREQVLERLAPKLHLPADELIEKVDAGDSRPLESVVLAENVTPRLYYYLAQRRRQFPGVGLEEAYLRTYPRGDLAAHVLGQTGKIGAGEIDDYRRRGYAGDETVGKGGIEQEYEQFLKGTPGAGRRGGRTLRGSRWGARWSPRGRRRRVATSSSASTDRPSVRCRTRCARRSRWAAPPAPPAWHSTRPPARSWPWRRIPPSTPPCSWTGPRSRSTASTRAPTPPR